MRTDSKMLQGPSVTDLKQERVPVTLGDEEEAWHRHNSRLETTAAIKVWIRKHDFTVARSDNPLADEEEAWVRG